MTTERLGGASPSNPMRNNTPDTKAQREERQRVEKVREIDPDEETQQRRRKFQMMMGDEDVPKEEAPKPPSPFQVEFHLKTEASVSDDEETPLPLTATPPAQNPVQPTDDLPQSDNFWEQADLPPDLPPKPTTYQEVTASKKQGKEASLFPGAPADPFKAPSSKKPPSSSKENSPPFFYAAPHSKDEEEAPLNAPFFPPHKPSNFSLQDDLTEEETETFGSPASSSKEKKSSRNEMAPFGNLEEPSITPVQKKKEEQKKEQRVSFSPHMEATALPPIPPDVQPVAQTALTQAQPYLNPETVPLFFQMVGAMYWMISPPGVNRTEFVLNHPAYINSKFYGARILIEKYTSAPDSFNIRLTGSDAAVTAFKEHIPTLLTAFQKGNFPFRIHRMDADYNTDRPVFRRKERQSQSDSDMGGDFKDKEQ